MICLRVLGEAICVHDGLVVLLVGFTKLGWHRSLIVEVSERAIRVEGAGVEDGLRCLLDFCLLRWLGVGPREIVVDDVLGIAVVTLDASTYSANPSHMDVGCNYAKVIKRGTGNNLNRIIDNNLR